MKKGRKNNQAIKAMLKAPVDESIPDRWTKEELDQMCKDDELTPEEHAAIDATLPKAVRGRVPKPYRSPAIDELCEYWLPFLSLDGRKATREELIQAAFNILEPSASSEAMATWGADKESHLRETQRMCKKAVLIALGRDRESHPDELSDWLTGSTEDWRPRSSSWKGPGACEFERFSYHPKYMNANTPEDVRALVALSVGVAFGYGQIPPGPFFIGCCPKCGKVFEKKQSNAEYCSKYCIHEVFRTTKKK